MCITNLKNALLMSSMLIFGGAAQAATISLAVADNALVGEDISVQLLMNFDPQTEPTLGGGIDVSYDSAVADFVSFTFDSAFAALSDPAFSCPASVSCGALNQPGLVSNIAFGNFNGIAGSLTIGTLVFNTLQAGTLNLQPATNASASGPFVSAITFDVLPVTFESASVVVTAVPVPAAAWLFGSALVSLLLGRQRLNN